MNFPLFPEEASTLAPHVDALFAFVLAITAFFSLLIASLIIFFAVRYHHRAAVDRRITRDSYLLLELTWTGIPLGIVMVIFVWGAFVFYKAKTMPPNAIEMFVVGKQWMWKIQHPEGQREINAMHIPVGRPIQLTMISEDVIHDFAIPAFRIKQDVLPGRYTKEWFQATRPGTYMIFCNQYCGTLHAQMIGKVVAMTPPDYQRWLAGGDVPTAAAISADQAAPAGSEAGMAAAGDKLFHSIYNCVSCHKPVAGGQGPSLNGLFGRTVQLEDGKTVVADEGYIRESILQPNAKIVKGFTPVMPTYQGQMEESDILQLIAYIKSLKETNR